MSISHEKMKTEKDYFADVERYATGVRSRTERVALELKSELISYAGEAIIVDFRELLYSTIQQIERVEMWAIGYRDLNHIPSGEESTVVSKILEDIAANITSIINSYKFINDYTPYFNTIGSKRSVFLDIKSEHFQLVKSMGKVKSIIQAE